MLGFVSFNPLFAGIAVEPSHPFSSAVEAASVASFGSAVSAVRSRLP
jgi:hypothetical protein